MDSATTECGAALRQIIAAGIDTVERLQQALQDERHALEHQDSDALGVAADGKRVHVGKLEALEERRRAVCRLQGVDPGPEQMAALLTRCNPEPGNDKSLADGWQRFLALAGLCQQMNTTNGAIIQLRRQQFNEALCIVSGTSGESPETYGPGGSATSARPPRSLAEI